MKCYINGNNAVLLNTAKHHTAGAPVKSISHLLPLLRVAAGHYELNLSLPVHAAIAARLRDDSQSCPDGPTWINVMHDMAT